MGSLFFGYHKIHLIIVTFILASWFFFNSKCYLQIKYNEFCKLDKDERFKDLQSILFKRLFGLKNNIYKYLLILIVILYDIYHILY